MREQHHAFSNNSMPTVPAYNRGEEVRPALQNLLLATKLIMI